jgi:uncharacterized protein (DUF433 family)
MSSPGRLPPFWILLLESLNPICYDPSPRNSVVADLLNRISINPNVCFGKPCIKGTRIWVSLVLDFLADGVTEEELLRQYPQLSHQDILAAIAYGAEAARERIIPVPTDTSS